MPVYSEAFAKVAAKARPPVWVRPHLAQWKKGMSAARVTQDRKLLRQLMRDAKRSPTAQSALNWAKAHGIKFIVDHTTNAGGYYCTSTGVVALSAAALDRTWDPYYGVEVLVHEIRHAWQDHHGIIPSVDNYRTADLARSTIQQALYEADAFAHGKLANDECYGRLSNSAFQLRHYFYRWYAGNTATLYGTRQREFQGTKLGVRGCTAPDYKTEFRGVVRSAFAGINPWSRADLERLGKSFAGGNYIAGWRDDKFWRRILSPTYALRQFNDRGCMPRVANAVRAIQLTHRLKGGQVAP